MRIWHKDFIPVLPREQLVAAWRELSAIAGAVQKNGTPNHILVNFVLNYPWDDFISYAYYVREEMTKRGYRTMNSVWDKITGVTADYTILPFEKVYTEKMDNIYFKICFYNLYEKILCGGIQEPDSSRIMTLYEEKI